MKKLALITAVLATFAIAACGGSSSGVSDGSDTPTPTITNANSRAVSEATVQAVNQATFNAAESAMENLAPTASVSQTNTNKEAFSANVNYTYSCTVSGTVIATGTLTAQCTESGSSWSCTGMTLGLALQFNDCTETVTAEGIDYDVTLNGNGTSDMTGSAAGTDDTMNLDFMGTAGGTLTATGDANGIVTLNLGIAVTGSPDPDPTVTCSGTASVVADEVTQVCGVTSDCSGCEA